MQAGLHIIDDSVVKIRESVAYVRGSKGRKIKFAECISQLSLNCLKLNVASGDKYEDEVLEEDFGALVAQLRAPSGAHD